jgi:hypothetical protein
MEDPGSMFQWIGSGSRSSKIYPRSVQDLFLVWKHWRTHLGSVSSLLAMSSLQILEKPIKNIKAKNNKKIKNKGKVWGPKTLSFAYRIAAASVLKHISEFCKTVCISEFLRAIWTLE